MQNYGLMTPATFQQNRLQKQAFFQNMVMQGNQERMRKAAIEMAKKEQKKAEDKANKGGIWGAVTGAIGGGVTSFMSSGGNWGAALLGAAQGGMKGYEAGRQTGDMTQGALLGAAQGVQTGFQEKQRQDALLLAAEEKTESRRQFEKQFGLAEKKQQLAEQVFKLDEQKTDLLKTKQENEFVMDQLELLAKQSKDKNEAKVKQENFLTKLVDPQLTDFIEIVTAKNKIDGALKRDSAAGDMAAIFNFMKVLDPGSTVREGEFATAQNAAGVDEKIRNYWNFMLTGERLAKSQRQDFLKTTQELFRAEQESFRTRYNQISQMAVNQELDLVNIFGNMNPDMLNVRLTFGPKKPTAEPTPTPRQKKQNQRVIEGPKPAFFGRDKEKATQEKVADDFINRLGGAK